MTKELYFKTIWFSLSMQFSSIWTIDKRLPGATVPGQSRPGSDGNERVLRIPQSSSIIRISPSDCLVSYVGHSLRLFSLCRNAVGTFYSHNRQGNNLLILFTNPSARAGYDTRSIFKRSLTGLNSEFSFS